MKLFPFFFLTPLALTLPANGNEPAAKKVATVQSPCEKELLKASADYKAWGRVDDEMRWAPTLCRMPNPGQPAFSASKDEETHGQKLYSLFASKREDYFFIAKNKTAAVGQVIVKQSWVPEEITDPKLRPAKRFEFDKIVRTPPVVVDPKKKPQEYEGDHFYPYVWKGEKVFKASKQADLFVMMKLDPKTAGTDEGWVYATLTPDGKTLTSAGAVESCMKCHREAKNDRLFGLAK